jgi:ABC-type nickel/cobalt efflux system permease component RcnA
MMQSAPLALDLALVSAGLLGFRHGFDYDHVAAITDITSVQDSTRTAMKTGFMYVLGHAATVAVLGLGVIVFQLSLPAGLDSWMEHLVGVTLLVLGIYVIWTSFFQNQSYDLPGHPHNHHHAPRTRVTIMIDGILWLVWRVCQTFSSKPVQRHRLFGNGMGNSPALLVGVIHGFGAETPSQLMLFLLAANLGGIAKGVLGLGAFIAGLILMNTIMCAAAAGMFRASMNRPRTFQWVAGLSAAYSIGVGLVFIAGTSTVAAALGR